LVQWIPAFGLVADLLRLAQHGETMLVNIEIATAAFGGLAMTYKRPLCHCEESRQCRDDEAISTLATSPFAGITENDR